VIPNSNLIRRNRYDRRSGLEYSQGSRAVARTRSAGCGVGYQPSTFCMQRMVVGAVLAVLAAGRRAEIVCHDRDFDQHMKHTLPRAGFRGRLIAEIATVLVRGPRGCHARGSKARENVDRSFERATPKMPKRRGVSSRDCRAADESRIRRSIAKLGPV